MGGGSFSVLVKRGVDAGRDGRWLLEEQVECSGACHSLGAALHLELTVDGIDIRFDSAQCQDEQGRHITNGEAGRHDAQYVTSAPAQRVTQPRVRRWRAG